MSAFPQILWQPITKDLRGEFMPRAVLDLATNTAAAANLSVGWQSLVIAADKVFLLRWATAYADAGAGQTSTRVFLQLLRNPGALIQILAMRASEQFAVAQDQLMADWSGEIVMMPGDSLFAFAVFSAGAVNNNLQLHTQGIVVPRGNWQG